MAAMKRPTQTVGLLGLNHRNCGCGIGINGRPTAGQGAMDWAGGWEIPCPDCAKRVATAMAMTHQRGGGSSPDKRRRPA